MTEILMERQRELIGEGHAWFDVVRNIWKRKNLADFMFSTKDVISWNIGGTSSQDRFALKGYRFPIQNSILNSNKNINQIPYWMGKY